MPLTNLITDRNAADTAELVALRAKVIGGTATAEEVERWNRGDLRGAYNAADLNRVGEAMAYVAERLNSHGYSVKLSVKTDWDVTDWPDERSMAQYLADLSKLRRALSTFSTTPPVPADMEDLTLDEANDIEKILQDVDQLLTLAMQAWFYSGDLYGGEV